MTPQATDATVTARRSDKVLVVGAGRDCIAGCGFPRCRSSPMKHADTVGLPQVQADIRAFAPEGPLFWRPSPLRLDRVAHGKNFDRLNQPA